MRISFNMLYDQSVRSMNNSLSDIQRLTEQTASQKRVNRPSDDPSGMARVLDLTSSLRELTQYAENIDTAESWLTLADDTLSQSNDIVTRFKELCEQAATGTYTADERDMIAEEANELYEQLIGLANTDYAGDSIFAGTKTDAKPYELGLGATVREGVEVESVQGSAASTIYVEFADSGVVGTDTLNYRYTTDGGDTWTEATLNAGDSTLDLGTAQVELVSGSSVTEVTEQGGSEGSAIWVRPAAYYKGNADSDSTVLHYGASAVTAEASGEFSSPVTIRIDEDASLSGTVEYSYSTDNGLTWVSGQRADNGVFTVLGGSVSLEPSSASLTREEQFVISPVNDEINVNIGPGSSLRINNTGLDIFGGRTDSGDTDTGSTNLLETLGEFIGYLETNNQTGISQSLENLNEAQESLTLAMGEIGGRESRLEFADYHITLLSETLTQNISSIEDADLTELTTDLAKAEYIYEAVLSTTSEIIGMSLLNYI